MMNRAKSTLSLRNLANSIKQSINHQAHKTSKKQISLLKASNISININQQPQSQHYHKSQIFISKEQKQNRRYVLQKQISKLQKEIENNKNYIKNYTKELNEYEQLNQNVIAQDKLVKQEKHKIQVCRNQIMMLQEDIFSSKFNSQERIAQKQYFQVILDAYQRQYQAESALTMNIIHLEHQNTLLHTQITQISTQIQKTNTQINTWKQQHQFQLKNHKLKNSLKLIRVELFQMQDLCNTFCSQNKLKSLRQLYCLYYKIYSKRNGLGNHQGDSGLDLFVCRYGLAEDFSQFIRQRLVYNQFKCHNIQKYLDILHKMEKLYKKINIQPLAKMHDLYTSNLQQVKLVKNYKQMKIKENQVKIKEEHDKIDNMFNNQSIAIIQFLRSKNNNKYDIKQIKIKLKQYKKQQKQRILHIRNIYEQIKNFEKIIQKNQKNHIQQHYDKKQQIDQLYEDIFNCQAKIEQMTTKKLKLQTKKEQLQNFINVSLSKWKQSDENKQKLQKLYTQLNKIKQQQVEFEYTRNKLHSLHSFHSSRVKLQDRPFTTTTNNEQNNEIKSLKYQSKHNSVTSLHDSKSLLSLVNPIKRTTNLSHQYTQFQPILSDCQMILSKKLSSRDLNNKETAQKQKQKRYPMQFRFQSNTFLKKTTQKNQKQTQKQNTIWQSRHSKTANNQKLSISSKATTSQNLPTAKGKLIQSQRISLSNLLISKFNR